MAIITLSLIAIETVASAYLAPPLQLSINKTLVSRLDLIQKAAFSAEKNHLEGLDIRGIELLFIKGNIMTIGNALSFIKRSLNDADLRERLNGAVNKEELNRILAEEYISFSANDLDNAYNHRLTECQEADEAEQLKELKLWWDLLGRILDPQGCNAGCSGCC